MSLLKFHSFKQYVIPEKIKQIRYLKLITAIVMNLYLKIFLITYLLVCVVGARCEGEF